jgi:hypothetical protein
MRRCENLLLVEGLKQREGMKFVWELLSSSFEREISYWSSGAHNVLRTDQVHFSLLPVRPTVDGREVGIIRLGCDWTTPEGSVGTGI